MCKCHSIVRRLCIEWMAVSVTSSRRRLAGFRRELCRRPTDGFGNERLVEKQSVACRSDSLDGIAGPNFGSPFARITSRM